MNLKTYLTEKNITITDFARIAGLTKSCIHHIITGKRKNPSVKTVVRIQLASKDQVRVADIIGLNYGANGILKRLTRYENRKLEQCHNPEI